MALTPFKAPQSPLSRSRSSSCSSPVRNRIVYQEVFSIGANTLVRSYSCDQVFDNDGTGRGFQRTQIQVSSFVTPEKQNHIRIDDGKPKTPRRLMKEFPADKPDAEEVKRKILKEPSVVKSVLKKTIMFTFLTITSACALYLYFSYREYGVWDLQKTDHELREKVFGQNHALEQIMSVLKMVNSTNDVHTMIFTGGVGVGKTYASSIISSNFPWSSNKLISFSEHFREGMEKLLNEKLLTYGCNLVIVDDILVKSAKEVINLVVLLSNKRKHKENILIILIFHTQSEDDRNEIKREFKNTFLNVDYISFQPLTRGDVEKCFRFEIQRQGVIIPKGKLEELIEEQMKHIDVVKGPPGCKGVDVEVSSYFKKTVQ